MSRLFPEIIVLSFLADQGSISDSYSKFCGESRWGHVRTVSNRPQSDPVPDSTNADPKLWLQLMSDSVLRSRSIFDRLRLRVFFSPAPAPAPIKKKAFNH